MSLFIILEAYLDLLSGYVRPPDHSYADIRFFIFRSIREFFWLLFDFFLNREIEEINY